MVDLGGMINVTDFEGPARERLDPSTFAYYSGGACDEVTLKANVRAFEQRRLRPRVMRGVTGVDTSTTWLGKPVSMPLGLAPCALLGLAHADGEIASARAAESAGLVFCLSTWSSKSIEEVAEAGDGRCWFQLYVLEDRALSEDMLQRAAACGYEAVMLTVDLQVPGYRDRERRSNFTSTGRLGNLRADQGQGAFADVIYGAHDQSLTWKDLEWIGGVCGLPIIVKGILSNADARLAVQHGAAAVVVSNHGGRQLDRSAPAIDVLEEVVNEVGAEVEVFLDGGVRRGTDIVTAVALGARGVFFGRPHVYALAAAGREGVAYALELMRQELDTAMFLLGTPRIEDVTQDCLQ